MDGFDFSVVYIENQSNEFQLIYVHWKGTNMQWLNRCIHNPVFPGSNHGGGKVDSAFHHSEVSEMSSSSYY